jgi:hypothetical protein
MHKTVHNGRIVTPRLILPVILSAAALVGCGGEENRPAAWSYISPAIIQPNCATSSCHSKTAAVAGLDFSTSEEGLKGLTRQKLPSVSKDDGRDEITRQLIIWGNPDESRMVNMLRARGTWRMPPDRPLAEADIALIETWILTNTATSGAK